jgi:kynurenine formamidase
MTTGEEAPMAQPSASTTNWGRWGDEDERGAANLLTPETVLASLSACRTGKVYQLGLPIQRAGVPNVEYRGIPQRLTLVNQGDEKMYESYGGQPGVGTNEDVLVMASHTVTHMDALCHIYRDGAIYNGFPHDGMLAYSGAARCGIEKAGPIVTRGVLVDVAGHQGVDWLEPGHVITLEELTAALEAQGSEIQAGDAVLVRTGWIDWFFANGAEMSLVQPGIGLDVAAYLGDRDVVVVASDNSAVEAQPFDRGAFLGAHVELLAGRGIHLVEHLALKELAEDRCYACLFCVSPLLITGATASPVSPFAIG